MSNDDPQNVLPPYRQIWEDARLADAAWCQALRAHVDNNDPVTLPNRLAITAAAARNCSRTLEHAGRTGLAWRPFPGPASRYDLPGELARQYRPEHPDGWITLGNAGARLAEASCRRKADELARAFAFFGEACEYLRKQITPQEQKPRKPEH